MDVALAETACREYALGRTGDSVLPPIRAYAGLIFLYAEEAINISDQDCLPIDTWRRPVQTWQSIRASQFEAVAGFNHVRIA